MPITIAPNVDYERMGEAAHLAGQRNWAERRQARQQEIALANARMAQQQNQFQQQLGAQVFGRQQALDAANARMLYGANQQALRQQQQFQNTTALTQMRNQGVRDNYEYLNDQRHQQQVAYSNHRDADKITAAEQAYQNPGQMLNPNGQTLARKIREMEDRITGDDTLNPAEKELAFMKLARRKMALNSPQYAKQPELPPWEWLAPEYDPQKNPKAFHPEMNPNGALGPAGINVRTPNGMKYSQAGHRWTGATYTDDKGVRWQITYRGERERMSEPDKDGIPAGLGAYKWDFNKEWELAKRELEAQAQAQVTAGVDKAPAPVTNEQIIQRVRQKKMTVDQIQNESRAETTFQQGMLGVDPSAEQHLRSQMGEWGNQPQSMQPQMAPQAQPQQPSPSPQDTQRPAGPQQKMVPDPAPGKSHDIGDVSPDAWAVGREQMVMAMPDEPSRTNWKSVGLKMVGAEKRKAWIKRAKDVVRVRQRASELDPHIPVMTMDEFNAARTSGQFPGQQMSIGGKQVMAIKIRQADGTVIRRAYTVPSQ